MKFLNSIKEMPFIFLVKKPRYYLYNLGCWFYLRGLCPGVERMVQAGVGTTAGRLGAGHLLGDSEVGRQSLR